MKSKRHEKILEIISKKDVETQEELAEELKEAGLMLLRLQFQEILKF